MKRIKSSKGYSALEYTLLIAIVVIIALFFFLSLKNKDGTSAIEKGVDAVNDFIGAGPSSPGGDREEGEGGAVSSITVDFSGTFDYGFEDEIEVAVENYFRGHATVRKDGEVREDYTLSNIVRVGNYIQADVNVDAKTVRKQFAFNNLCLATDDFEWKTVSPWDGAFHYTGTAKCVEIPHVISGVHVTSYRAMFRNTNVEKVISTNPNVTTMFGMFEISQATTLDLSNFNTSNVTDMSSMFKASKVTTLDLSNFDTSKVTAMSSMFWDFQGTSLDLSNFNTLNVTNMNQMFRASKVTSLDLSRFNTFNVTDMAGMFHGSQATEIMFGPNFNTDKVQDMKWMFRDSKATTLDLLNFNTLNVTSMQNMFMNSQATSLDLSSFDFTNADVGSMFRFAQVTEVFVKDEASQTKLNNSSNKPAHTTISIK